MARRKPSDWSGVFLGLIPIAVLLPIGTLLVHGNSNEPRSAAGDAGGSAASSNLIDANIADNPGLALMDFQSRCASSGVLVCEGFDDPAEFLPARWPNTGLYPGSDNSYEIVRDTTIMASGAGSLKFPIKASDGTGPTVRDDNWLQTFCQGGPTTPCKPTVFGENSTFYVQFRYRVDTNYASTKWEDPSNGGSSPKIADFASVGGSCGSVELTTNNRGGTDIPMMYTDCGRRGLFVYPRTTKWNDSSPPYQYENGYYNCSYEETPSPPGGCFVMPPNTWMTFYYRVSIGTWGQPNSVIKAWVAPAGRPLNLFIDVEKMKLFQDQPGYNAIWFNVYMTSFLATARNPAANAWLDEVIVSSAPIPAPAGNGPTPQ